MANRFKMWLVAGLLLGSSSLNVQAKPIVNWGVSGGDTAIVTGTAVSAPGLTSIYGLVSPADGAAGYDLNAAGQTRTFYGAMSENWTKVINEGVPDYMQLVHNGDGAADVLTSMIAWESQDFLTSDSELENMTVQYESRGGDSTAAYFLIETTDGWYKSIQSDSTTETRNYRTWTQGAGVLTWGAFSEFGVTGGTGAADITDIQSVGMYFSSVNTSANFFGTKIEYVNVTASGAVNQPPVADAQSVDVMQNTFVDFTLTGSDPEGSNLTCSVESFPSNGLLTGTAPDLTYTPDTDYTGPDRFTFTVNDGDTNSAPATVSIDVSPEGDGAVINEFMAVNNTVLPDEDSDYSDWVELKNTSSSAVDLEGWYLTDNADDLTQWQFPATSLASGAYLVVFASSKDRAVAGSELHTNFKLSGDGEYLALIQPDGVTVASEFSPTFPPQLANVSYGIADGSSGIDSGGYLAIPTPGADNSIETPQASEPVVFSLPGAVYSASVQVELFATHSADTLYYTLDGSEPTAASSEYSGAISISSTTCLRARSFEAGLALGPVNSETYIFLDNDVKSFSSNLPVIVLDNLGVATNLPTTDEALAQSAILSIFEPGISGRTSLTNSFTLSTRSGIARRGETSLRELYKPNLAVETWGEGVDDDVKIAPLGMPSESDWVLWSPWETDPSGIRNALIYELSNQTGNYAVRTRFVEVFMNLSGGDLSMDDYAGFYVLMEKVKRGSDRVDVEAITPLDNTEPNVTGGYMLAIDKSDVNSVPLTGMEQTHMQCNDPRENTAQQTTYIQNYIINFEAQRWNPNPETGYPAYIDVDSFIDHHLLNMLARNPDGLRFSTFLSKPRSGKLTMGPIWDFDRSMESDDDRDDDPMVWSYVGSNGTEFFSYDDDWAWWQPLLSTVDFWQSYIDHWQDVRMNAFSTSNVTAVIDKMAAEVAEARARDIAKWTGFVDPRPRAWLSAYLSPRTGDNGLDGTQQGEINHLKWWWSSRLDWIDPHFVSMPVLSQTSGPVSGDFQLSIHSPSGDPIYYTLDGSDPRASGGSVSVSAVEYTGSIIISPDTIVCCRAWDGTTWSGVAPDATPWSGLAKGIFHRADQKLYLTEVHYNPGEPETTSIVSSDYFEFLELQNIGTEPLDLRGYSLDGGIDFSFGGSAVEELPAGEFVVVVRDLAAFSSRYNTDGMVVAGEYDGKLSNSGDNIRLEFFGEKLFDISYNDLRGWPAAAAGGGHSLIPLNDQVAAQGFDILDYWGNWRQSAYVGGSPGTEDPEFPVDLVINEVVAHTDTRDDPPFDSNDQIELYNPTDTEITLDGNWYLSDSVADPERYNLPAGTDIPSKGWKIFDEDDFHPDRVSGFGLDKAGEQVVLSHRPGDGLNRIVDAIVFKGQAREASWGRWPDGDGFFQTLKPTEGRANELSDPGIRIEELMYHSPNWDEVYEYILLTNASSVTVVFDGTTEGVDQTWRFNGGVEYDFDPGFSLAPRERLWMVPFDFSAEPAALAQFCAICGLQAGAERFAGPYGGDLSNGGERIRLERPQASDDPEVLDDISWILVDEATWFDEAPWPETADGTGAPLVRVGASGNDPLSWTTAVDSDGDGILDWEEYVAGTDPRNDASGLWITGQETVGNQLVFDWQAVSGKTYSIWFKTNLMDSVWTQKAFGIPGAEPSCTRTVVTDRATGFIRIEVE